ncbi:MAG: c-type cytochrome [Planctomycetes bacterium]|nr:c-type cytochrome [Planctomycetota bacterium]
MKPMRNTFALAACLVLAACGFEIQIPRAGGPLDDITTEQRAAFDRGSALMRRRFTPSEGLGPLYNASSCAACHEQPVTGGGAPNYRNFFLVAMGPQGSQVPLPISNLPSQVLPSFFGPGFRGGRIVVPVTGPQGLAITMAQRAGPPLFGTGLFALVTNATIIALSDPDDADGDGISGRFNRAPGLLIGRFGFKSQANNIESFIRGAARNQMGVTTNPVLGSGATVSLSSCRLPQVPTTGPNDPITDEDTVADPEVSVPDFADIIAFCRFLAPPRRLDLTAPAARGQVLFESIGCAKCHLMNLTTSRGTIQPFTDLLIHDMGPQLADGISQGSPQPSLAGIATTGSEYRTAPLWGAALNAPYLHDGRAGTLLEAITMHAGEADAIRITFEALSAADQADLIAFLEGL